MRLDVAEQFGGASSASPVRAGLAVPASQSSAPHVWCIGSRFPSSASPLENPAIAVICVAVKTLCLILLTCGTMIFSGCATDQDFNEAEAAKTKEKVPGETNPDAPDASQQQQAKPGFRF